MDTESLAQAVGGLLLQHHLTLGLAESCTGGMVASYITDIAGSSAYFEGAIVAYSTQMKERILGVPASTLERYGAVCAETVMAMAKGARKLLHVDVAVAITGIAGPSGGAPDKPVGLTYIGLASPHGELWRKYVWKGNRRHNREQSARTALELLKEHLESSSEWWVKGGG
jgi:nicotinamide-nucleotide amidase